MLPSISLKLLTLIQIHPSSDYSSRQIPSEETPTLEQESDNPVGIDTQTVDSLVQHTTNGKKIIYIFYPSAITMN